MTHRKAEAAGVAVAGLVALHEHSRTLEQERRLAGRPSFWDGVPVGLFVCIVLGLMAYGMALLVASLWPWLLGAAVLVPGWRVLWRRRRRRSEP